MLGATPWFPLMVWAVGGPPVVARSGDRAQRQTPCGGCRGEPATVLGVSSPVYAVRRVAGETDKFKGQPVNDGCALGTACAGARRTLELLGLWAGPVRVRRRPMQGLSPALGTVL